MRSKRKFKPQKKMYDWRWYWDVKWGEEPLEQDMRFLWNYYDYKFKNDTYSMRLYEK